MKIMTVKTPEMSLVYMPSLQCAKYSQQNESQHFSEEGGLTLLPIASKQCELTPSFDWDHCLV